MLGFRGTWIQMIKLIQLHVPSQNHQQLHVSIVHENVKLLLKGDKLKNKEVGKEEY